MIKSMTGFASLMKESDLGVLTWEVRSVNGRYLDLNFKLPDIFRELEPKFRELTQKYLSRGKVDCLLRYRAASKSGSALQVNDAVVKAVLAMAEQVQSVKSDIVMPTAWDILSWPGVTDMPETNKARFQEQALQSFEEVLQQLTDSRLREGEKLREFIGQRLESVLSEVKKVEAHFPDLLLKHRDHVIKRCEELHANVEPERLAQEVAILAQRMDISEELDRLHAHVEEVFRTLEKDEVVGRRLDFLMQELNREANTLGSKSLNEMTSHAAIELKVLIEQMREQVQNVE